MHNRNTYCRPYYYRRYGFFNFIGDIFMICITGGLWLLWIFVREMRIRG